MVGAGSSQLQMAAVLKQSRGNGRVSGYLADGSVHVLEGLLAPLALKVEFAQGGARCPSSPVTLQVRSYTHMSMLPNALQRAKIQYRQAALCDDRG